MPALKKGRRTLVHTASQGTAGIAQGIDLQLPQKFIQRLWLWVEAQLNITVAVTRLHSDLGVRAIRSLELKVDGDTWKQGRGPSFFRLAQYYDQTPGINSGLSAIGVGVQSFVAAIPLFFTNPATRNPNDTIFDARRPENVSLHLTWGAGTDLAIGGTAALQNGTCEIYADIAEPFGFDGGYVPGVLKQREELYPNILTASSNRLKVAPSEGVMRSILFNAMDADEPSDAIINTFRSLKLNGSEDIPLEEVDAAAMRAMVAHEYGVTTVPTGYYLMELIESGMMSTGLGAGLAKPLRSIDVYADTTVGAGTTDIHALVTEAIPDSANILAVS